MTEPRARLGALLERDIPLVVKIGSSLLIDEDGQPRMAWMRGLAAALAPAGTAVHNPADPLRPGLLDIQRNCPVARLSTRRRIR